MKIRASASMVAVAPESTWSVRPLSRTTTVPATESVPPEAITVVPASAWVPPLQSKAPETVSVPAPPSMPPVWVRLAVVEPSVVSVRLRVPSEMASVPWSLFKFSGDTGDTWGPKFFDEWVNARLKHMEPVFAKGEWLAGSFSVADILMADVLRLVDRFDGLADYPAARDYVARATARPAFVKAHADQMAHFAAAD